MHLLFSTTERFTLLESLVFKTGRLSVNHVASQLHLSKGLVSKYVDLLIKEGLAKRVNGKFIINESSDVVKGVRLLLNVKRIPSALFKKYPFVQGAGLYGSCAKGENTEDSDVDLWIRIGKASDEQLAAFTAALRRHIERVNLLFLTDKKLAQLKREDELFYHALSFGSLVLYGASYGLEL